MCIICTQLLAGASITSIKQPSIIVRRFSETHVKTSEVASGVCVCAALGTIIMIRRKSKIVTNINIVLTIIR